MSETTFKIPTRLRRGYTLMLRTCIREDDGRLASYDGFEWPAFGPVECPQPHPDFPQRHWDSTPECGNGLHGFLRGCGDHNLADWTERAAWLVVEVKTSDIVNLKGKVKVPCGRVLFSGDRIQALELMARLGHLDEGHMGGTSTSGDGGTATAGDHGTATAGYGGTAAAGYRGTATAGNYGTATAGDYGTATAGYRGTATAGYRGTATAGYRGTATAGYRGTATAGDHGTATAGDRGTATAGDGGTATAGDHGTATAGYRGTSTSGDGGTSTSGDGGTSTSGDGGTLIIKWWDSNAGRYRVSSACVGDEGITAGTKYQLDSAGKFIAVT